MRRTQAAADAGDADGDAWLDAVLKESMRLHPVIPMVVRTLMKPQTIAGIDLPRGATVGPSILIAHSREDNYDDPERFDPERFLGHNPPTNTWIPFGGGVRRCIGAGFAMMEGVAVLREVFRGGRRHHRRRPTSRRSATSPRCRGGAPGSRSRALNDARTIRAPALIARATRTAGPPPDNGFPPAEPGARLRSRDLG